VLGLDARPLDAEAERVQAERSDRRHVVRLAVVEVARVGARLPEHRVRQVLEHPNVARDVRQLCAGFELTPDDARRPHRPARRLGYYRPRSAPAGHSRREQRGIGGDRRSYAPNRTTHHAGLQDFYGSDGTRTRDLRRDRSAVA
jgi:hypothetical protein